MFWPQSGEYQNTTFFVTDASYRDNIQWTLVPARVAQLALFTDGLQMLALNYASRAVHQPFFAPLFDALASVDEVSDLQVPMRQFLDSPRVNERTDDDKTLILATRVSEHADVPA